MDFETELYDRLSVIRTVINKYGEDKFYVSLSGGKDSTVLHYMIDEALPNNRIPRVFINTGIEYLDIMKFVKELQKEDDRIEILTVGKHIKKTLDRVGYPFKSKEHSNKLMIYQNIGESSKTYQSYMNKERFGCPQKLRFQFTEEYKLNISDNCCREFKKKPIHKYEMESKRVAILGLRQAEGGLRGSHSGCIITKDGEVKRFKPLNPVSDRFMDEYVKSRNIKLCKLYYPPYNFKRTGCKGCPFNINLKKDLAVMKDLLPVDYYQCEYIWKPIYDEYRRIGYRLDKDEQLTLF